MRTTIMLNVENPDEAVNFGTLGPLTLDSNPTPYFVLYMDGSRVKVSVFLSPTQLTELRDLLTAKINEQGVA